MTPPVNTATALQKNVAEQSASTSGFCSQRLENVFNSTFASHNTLLVGGYDEPIYLPQTPQQPHNLLCYREDFFASALHEIAHWCVAGEERRAQVDFGYWYAPEGRDALAQEAFEHAEVKPQTLEWYFSLACNYRFIVSVDNLAQTTGALADTLAFEHRLIAQAERWLSEGFPRRAQQIFQALSGEFGTSGDIPHDAFTLAAFK